MHAIANYHTYLCRVIYNCLWNEWCLPEFGAVTDCMYLVFTKKASAEKAAIQTANTKATITLFMVLLYRKQTPWMNEFVFDHEHSQKRRVVVVPTVTLVLTQRKHSFFPSHFVPHTYIIHRFLLAPKNSLFNKFCLKNPKKH